MSGVKGRSGRRKKLTTQYDEWIKDNPVKVATLLDILYQKGLNGDKDAAIYVIDRILGRPKQAVDIKARGQILITADMRAMAAREMLEIREEETKLLTGSDNAIQEQAEG